MNRRQLAKEIDTLRTRLTRRLSNVERRGLASELTNEARTLDLSVRGKSDKELRQLRRDLKRFLNRQSTSVRGAKNIQGVVNIVQQNIKDYESLSKYRQKRYKTLVNKAYEIFTGYRDKHFKYKMQEYIMKQVKNRKSSNYILGKLEKMADDISNGNDNEDLFDSTNWSKLK